MQLVNNLYPKVASLEAAAAAANAQKLQRIVVRDWLIVPCHEIAPEDDDTPEWKSRDIDAQKTVLVGVDTSGIIGDDTPDFPGFLAFREWSMTRSIAVPAYEYRRTLDNGMLEIMNLYIGHDQQKE